MRRGLLSRRSLLVVAVAGLCSVLPGYVALGGPPEPGSAAEPRLDGFEMFELPAAAAAAHIHAEAVRSGAGLDAAGLSPGVDVVAVPRAGMSIADVRELAQAVGAGLRVARVQVALPGASRTTTSAFGVPAGTDLEVAIAGWEQDLRRALEENIATEVASLPSEERAALLGELPAADAAEMLANSREYIRDARRMLDQLRAGTYVVYGVGMSRQGGESAAAVDAALDAVRSRDLGMVTAPSGAMPALVPPVDAARDGMIDDLRSRGALPSQRAGSWAEGAAGTPNLATTSAESTAYWEGHIPRDGVMTWTPLRVDPDFVKSPDVASRRILEADLTFGSAFRVSGHDGIFCYGGWCEVSTYEWEFELDRLWGIGYDGFYACDLPSPCVLDSQSGDPVPNNYAVVSGAALGISANETYHVDIGIARNRNVDSTNVQLRSIAASMSSLCPFKNGSAPDPALCSFQNYSHWYNKEREHAAPGKYPAYLGGSYIKSNTFSPCPGHWTAVDLAYSCSPFSDGPEPPGRITIQPAAASTAGNLYRTIPFSVRPQDHFSVEYVVRCITGATCRGRLGWQGRGLNAVDSHVSPKFTIPNDGRYYLCRFDSNHGAAGGAIRSNTKLRVRLFNVESGTQLRIDAMALYGYVGYHDGFDDNPTDVKFCNAL